MTITPVRPAVIKPAKAPKKAKAHGWKTAVILPDPQFGYRNVGGVLDPFHDERALGVAAQILSAVQRDEGIDVIVNLGDFLDLPAHSRYEQLSVWQSTTQAALDRGHDFLALQRASAPWAEIVVLEGNHDKRLADRVLNFNLAYEGLRRANMPEDFPVYSAPHLLRVEDLGVDWLDGYPARKYWLNDWIKCVHGDIVRASGSTAQAYAAKEITSTIFGHVHRIEVHHTTKEDRHGPVRIFAATPGCLCRVDGAVPSVKGASTLSGAPIKSYETWSQGLLIVHYREDSPNYATEMVHIQDGWALFRGTEVSATL